MNTIAVLVLTLIPQAAQTKCIFGNRNRGVEQQLQRINEKLAVIEARLGWQQQYAQRPLPQVPYQPQRPGRGPHNIPIAGPGPYQPPPPGPGPYDAQPPGRGPYEIPPPSDGPYRPLPPGEVPVVPPDTPELAPQAPGIESPLEPAQPSEPITAPPPAEDLTRPPSVDVRSSFRRAYYRRVVMRKHTYIRNPQWRSVR